MNEYQRMLILIGIMVVILTNNIRLMMMRRRSMRRYWTHPMLANSLSTGYFQQMYGELRRFPENFFNFTRMSISTFDVLLDLLRPQLTRQDTRLRKSVSAEERLLVTLRYLATGQSFASLHRYFRLGLSTLSRVTRETCRVICEELREVVLPEPTEKLWETLADEFREKTQFPNCIGALDGKHIRVKMPPNSGSQYFNSNEYYSVVLLAVADARLRFTCIDVGSYANETDSRIFRESTMGRRIYEGNISIPPRGPLPGTTQPSLPHVIVAGEAFGFPRNLLCPYSGGGLTVKQRIFNYRLSRAHWAVDRAFGILTAKWRVLLSAMQLDAENAIQVVFTCCVLHNLVIERERRTVDPEPSNPANALHVTVLSPRAQDMEIRNQFADYFMSPEGELLGQNEDI